MNSEKSVMVTINEIAKIKEFAQTVTKFESDVNIIKGAIVYDAKSILGVLALDTSMGVYVEILSDNQEEIDKFINEMEKFK